jgi:multiple sugar transport system substrate-binding protein
MLLPLTSEESEMARREALKALGAGVLAAGGAWVLGRDASAAAPALRYAPEKGARLRFLRWKRFVQGDEDQWLASTRLFTEQTGVPVQVESVSLEDLPSKAAMAANVGAGPDLVMGSYGQPQLYPDKCLDLTELAAYLGEKYGGWYDSVKAYCTTEGRWIALGLAFPTSCVVYRQSMVRAAGFEQIPRDLSGFLKLCRALRARGTPAGFTLGNAIGDATTWCHWLIWSHGGKLVDASGRVVINSRETVAALEYARELYPTLIPGTLSWLDPSNNKAFLAGQVSLTYNGISVYYAARNSPDPALQAIAADMQHAHFPVGPVGRPTELSPFAPAWVFNYTRYPNAAREYLRFMLERDQYAAWLRAAQGYFAQTLRAYESDPLWTQDPRNTPFRDGPAMTLHPGYAGKEGVASAAAVADFVVVNMVAEAATGRSSVQAAAARAEGRARRYYKA